MKALVEQFIKSLGVIDQNNLEGLKRIQSMLFDFAEENDFIIASLDTTWIDGSEARRNISDYKNVNFKSYPKLSDIDFVNLVFKKFKNRNLMTIQSNFFGYQTINFYYS